MKNVTKDGVEYAPKKDTITKEFYEIEPVMINASIESVPFKIGVSYFFRTVTYHCTGRVKAVVGKFLVLEDASWIADSGRFNEFVKGTPTSGLEVEPYGDKDMYLNIDSIVDSCESKLYTEVK